ncbi:pyrimidine pathway regulatory protein 1 [Phialemonium atrogriseum]|uniref:Pyrimidine pathway regulatory protein 1 n=1 Tax=Phialemonium atrogriseum TaxID=1093897 RepID=A0AAJ0FK35_9PEZI|nr:pyrimidine pathway regulatory protein 1 [Phialemonium atrogriseum]KAK1765988.1 pyrimidine pathway regulatory protein 1 [Phialemonium atrogriseum]
MLSWLSPEYQIVDDSSGTVKRRKRKGPTLPTMSGRSRQQPGSACEECRKRKLRCDRQVPRCATCVEAGITCEVNPHRQPRGPKKGDLKALRSRIVALERCLMDQQSPLPSSGDTSTVDLSEDGPTRGNSVSDEELSFSMLNEPPSAYDCGLPDFSQFSEEPTPKPEISPTSTVNFIPELMRADLDQLYFDRVQPILPILHQGRYFAWCRQPSTEEHYTCLQYAMWTLAMAMSTQFEHMREMLYTETRHMLEAQDLREQGMGIAYVEQAQAWLLITFYEFLRTNYRRGWISAGRTFRLIQLLRLHDIDSPNGGAAISGQDWITLEVKRRIFWVAYCLDRFISVRNEWPLTLHEEVICTRLPSAEADFQRGQPTQVCFLSEAITSDNTEQFSPLAECVILVTICGRALSHSQVSTIERIYGNEPLDFWQRHEWLDATLTKRTESLSLRYSAASGGGDPMLLFTLMVSQATVIYLCKILESLAWETDEYRDAVINYQERAIWAGREIARLVRDYEGVGYFKAHIFLPVAIFLGLERLIAHRNTHNTGPNWPQGGSTDAAIEGLLEVLRNMQSLNSLASYHLHILESGAFAEMSPLS